MRVAARAGRFGLMLALLLMLFGVSAPLAPGTGVITDVVTGDAGQHQASVIGETASAAPSIYDNLQDWLRLSMGAPRAMSTALPDTWWAVCPRATGGCALQGRLLIGEGASTARAAAARTPRSSRAPPFA